MNVVSISLSSKFYDINGMFFKYLLLTCLVTCLAACHWYLVVTVSGSILVNNITINFCHPNIETDSCYCPIYFLEHF